MQSPNRPYAARLFLTLPASLAFAMMLPMHRPATHLWLMSAIAAFFLLLWGVFALFPRLDIVLSQLFYDAGHPNHFALMEHPMLLAVQEGVYWLAYSACALPAALLLARRWRPEQPLWRDFTAAKAAFLWLALVLGPGLTVHAGFKAYFERPRPFQSDVFGGELAYLPPMVVGQQGGKSFVSGHASMGFYVCAFALLAHTAKRQRQLYALGIAAGLFLGVCRIVQGRHFASDILFSGAVTLMCIHVAFLLVMVLWPQRGRLSTNA